MVEASTATGIKRKEEKMFQLLYGIMVICCNSVGNHGTLLDFCYGMCSQYVIFWPALTTSSSEISGLEGS
jgi:hypothetical protein